MSPITRQTIRHSVIGALVGVILGFVPLVLLIAPFIGGAVAGYLEREGPKQGAIAGGVAGVVLIVLQSAIVGVIRFIRFGDVPLLVPEASVQWLGMTAFFFGRFGGRERSRCGYRGRTRRNPRRGSPTSGCYITGRFGGRFRR